ncbi:unnamed protein product [Hyaloperonospora brassicae]|uniref:EF-hand domain-containing protein n=1 Tax=Hyaloperonospora brassicae TaxID=162125 RepID=A0AAV0TCY7_HYABA|nr:unnamed protein product [Hyaloperonospora brassicae]
MARRMAPARAVQTYERQALREDEMDELREAFRLFDADGSGAVDLEELQTVMQSLGYETTSKCGEVHHEGKRCSDEKRVVDMETFVDMLGAAEEERDAVDEREEIQRVFGLFDDDKTGKISFRKLRRVVQELSEAITDAELLEMIERADLNQDGEVDADEFYAMMTKQTFT